MKITSLSHKKYCPHRNLIFLVPLPSLCYYSCVMKSASRIFPPGADTPFAYWMKLCLLPANAFYEAFDGDRNMPFGRRCGFQVMIMTAVLAAACGGTGLAVWGLMKMTGLCLRRTRRRIYYPAEARRRRQLAAERRKIRRRTTINAIPTADELIAQFARVKRNPQEMIRFGSMLEDLEAYVDNSLRRNDAGTIIGRNPGIKGWLSENCAELAAKYTTVMRYKALAKQFRQVVGLRDPYPAAISLPENAAESRKEENKITERTSIKHLPSSPEIEQARKAAREFFGKCKATRKSLIAELDTRLRPELVPAEVIRRERTRQGLSPTPALAERIQNMLA